MGCEPRQKIMESIGKDGCYFLSVVNIAEEIVKHRIDAIDVYLEALAEKWMRDDCYMIDPPAILGYMTGTDWIVEKMDPQYLIDPGEYEILKFERADGTGHFVVGDGFGKVKYDPYGDSKTVREGWVVSKRIFSRRI